MGFVVLYGDSMEAAKAAMNSVADISAAAYFADERRRPGRKLFESVATIQPRSNLLLPYRLSPTTRVLDQSEIDAV
jgi:hypothetical protein